MNNNSLNEASTKEKLISVTQYTGTGNLSVLSDFFGGYNSPLFNLACINAVFFIDIQSQLESRA